jgi:hypothetical protein
MKSPGATQAATLPSSVFRGPAWEGSVLRINLGTVALRLERECE